MHTEFVLSTDLNLIIWFQVSDLMESIKFYKACLAEHSFMIHKCLSWGFYKESMG